MPFRAARLSRGDIRVRLGEVVVDRHQPVLAIVLGSPVRLVPHDVRRHAAGQLRHDPAPRIGIDRLRDQLDLHIRVQLLIGRNDRVNALDGRRVRIVVGRQQPAWRVVTGPDLQCLRASSASAGLAAATANTAVASQAAMRRLARSRPAKRGRRLVSCWVSSLERARRRDLLSTADELFMLCITWHDGTRAAGPVNQTTAWAAMASDEI